MYMKFYVAVSIAALAAGTCQAQSTGSGATPASDPAASAAVPGGSTTPTDASPSQVEDIIVTAQRRRENLQNVPVAVTAVSAARLAASNITSVADIGKLTPNLILTQTAGTIQPHIRGVGTNFSGPGIENPVATYIDGVYIASGTASLLTLNNIDQVAVLKGPQGTLFGRNATGGLIQVTTKDPVHTPSAAIDLSYANYDTATANTYLTSGLSDTLAADIAFRFERQGDGYGTNFFNGHDVNRVYHDIAARSKLLFEPDSATTVRLAFDYADRKINDTQIPYPGYPQSFNNPFFGGPFRRGGAYDIDHDVDDNARLKSGGVSLQIEHRFDAVNFQSISAYRRSEYSFDLDLDLTPVSLISCCGKVRAQQLSQEFQFSSAGSGPLKWVGGVFLFAAKDGYDGVTISLDGPVSPVPGSRFDIRFDNQVKTRSAAIYGQASYEFLPATTLTLGGRFTYEDRKIGGTETDIAGGTTLAVLPLPVPGSGFPSKLEAKRFNYRIALDHQISADILAYASWNTGFKSGGYNLNSSANAPYRPESIKAAEIGIKTQLFDRRVRLNAAAFHYDYSNIQVANFTGGTTLISNGAKARIYGFDLDANVVLGGGLSLDGGVGYIHDRFTSYPDAPFFPGVAGCAARPGSFCAQSAKGNKLGQTPTWTYNIGGTYQIALPSGSLTFNAVYAYSSRWYASADNYAYQPAYAILNASVQWTLADSGLAVRLWGKNLTNRIYANSVGEANQGIFRQLAAPRTYGATLSVKFK